MATLLAVAAVLTGLWLRVTWALLLPFNDAPDEYCHFAMLKVLREGRLPTMADVPEFVPVSYPALPPVGYLPAAATARFCDADSPHIHHAARMGNVLLGTLTIAAGFGAARRLFPQQPAIAAATAWLFALHPQFVFLSAYVNNDAAAVLLCTLLWGEWIAAARSLPSRRRAIGIGLLAALAMLCKTASASAIAGGLVIALHAGWTRRFERRVLLSRLGWAGAAAAVACAPWIAFSLSQHSSVWGVEIHRQWWFDFISKLGVEQGFLGGGNLRPFVWESYRSFWASFGYCTTWLEPLEYHLISGAIVATLVAGMMRGRQLACWTRPIAERPSHAARVRARSILAPVAAGLAVAVAFAWLLHGWHSRSFGYAPQGRYLMPALLPVLLMMASGSAVLVRGRPWLGAVALAALFGWIAAESLRVERASNRFEQPTRQVKATLLSYGSPPAGSARRLPFDFTPLADGGFGFSASADGLARLQIDQYAAPGKVLPCQLIVTNDAGASQVIDFWHVGNSAFRYRFDFRSVISTPDDASDNPSNSPSGNWRVVVRPIEPGFRLQPYHIRVAEPRLTTQTAPDR